MRAASTECNVNLPLEIYVHPERLMIGTGSVGVDASCLHPACQRGGYKAEVDPLGVGSGRAFILASAGIGGISPSVQPASGSG
jgi:hypothetical protein